jgi:chromosome segregation ATPase
MLFVKKDVNFVFFGLLLLMMVAMAGVMLYSDYTYHKVNGDYLKFKEMYDAAQADLNASRAEVRAKELSLEDLERNMTDLWSELQLSKQKETSLSGYYTTVKTEKQQLNENLSKALTDIDRCRSDYESSRLTLSVCQRDIELEKKSVTICKQSLVSYQVGAADAALKAEQLAEAMETFGCKNKSICQEDLEEAKTLLSTLQSRLNSMTP